MRNPELRQRCRFVLSWCCVLAFVPLIGGADWPEFRGPTHDGHAPPGLPLHWSETEHVKWKTPLPNRGWSTPAIIGNQIWLTTATPDGHDFFALRVALDSGKLELTKHLFHSEKPEPLGNAMNCYASPSPVVEPGRVYVHFGSYGTACLDSDTGEVRWQRRDLPCRHYRGPGSSPILWRDLLILTMDGVDVQYTVALNAQTGETVWTTDRTTEWHDLDEKGKPRDEGDLRKAYSTPLVADVNGQPQLLSVGAMSAFAYDPRTGRELWKIRHGGYSGATRPVFGHGLAFLASGSGKTELLAVRPDGRGDVGDSHVAWRTTKAPPRLPSPVLVGDWLFTLSDNGFATCWLARTGQEVWKERLPGDYAASMLVSGDRIYCCNTEGRTTVFRAAGTFERLAENRLDAGFLASPAAAGRSLILRTKSHLYRVEE